MEAAIADNNAIVGGVRLLDVTDAPTDGFNALLDAVLKGSQQKKGSLDFLRRLSQGLQLINGAGASANSKLEAAQAAQPEHVKAEAAQAASKPQR